MNDPTRPDPTSLYRFHDGSGRLLYVGITRRGWRRFDEHASSKPWWHLVRATTVEHYDTREAARAAELAAIRSEGPVFNIADMPKASAPRAARRAPKVDQAQAAEFPCALTSPVDARTAMPCRVQTKRGDAHITPVWLYWEVDLDPITDDWLVDEISPWELFDRWHKRVTKRRPDTQTVPVHWFVEGRTIFEGATPYDYGWFETYYLPLRNAEHTLNVPLQCLPVVDKHWCHHGADKGGFMQEATGWKPQPLQPEVILTDLVERARFHASRWDAR